APDRRERLAIAYRKARVLSLFDRFEEAIPLFRDIAENHPNSELALDSADSLFDVYAERRQLGELKGAVDRLCGPSLTVRDAAFDEAAARYEELATRWPDEREAQAALARAAFLRRGLGDDARADADDALYRRRYGGRDGESLAVAERAAAHVERAARAWRAAC